MDERGGRGGGERGWEGRGYAEREGMGEEGIWELGKLKEGASSPASLGTRLGGSETISQR